MWLKKKYNHPQVTFVTLHGGAPLAQSNRGSSSSLQQRRERDETQDAWEGMWKEEHPYSSYDQVARE